MISGTRTTRSLFARWPAVLLALLLFSLCCLSQQVYRTRIGDEFAWRDVEYDIETGTLIFVGEQYHGLDLEDGFWWCGMNYDFVGNGLLEFLMENSSQSRDDQMREARQQGHRFPSWINSREYPTTFLRPMANVRVYANKDEPESSRPPALYTTTRPGTNDYVTIDADPLVWLLSWEVSTGMFYFGTSGDGVSEQIDGKVPPGDGTSDHDNGVRVHLSFLGQLQLSEDAKAELRSRFSPVGALYNESSEAYPFVSYDHSQSVQMKPDVEHAAHSIFRHRCRQR